MPFNEGDHQEERGAKVRAVRDTELLERVRKIEQDMSVVTVKVGEGVHEKHLMNQMAIELVDLGFRTTQLEHAVYYSWELKAEEIKLEQYVLPG